MSGSQQTAPSIAAEVAKVNAAQVVAQAGYSDAIVPHDTEFAPGFRPTWSITAYRQRSGVVFDSEFGVTVDINAISGEVMRFVVGSEPPNLPGSLVPLVTLADARSMAMANALSVAGFATVVEECDEPRVMALLPKNSGFDLMNFPANAAEMVANRQTLLTRQISLEGDGNDNRKATVLIDALDGSVRARWLSMTSGLGASGARARAFAFAKGSAYTLIDAKGRALGKGTVTQTTKKIGKTKRVILRFGSSAVVAGFDPIAELLVVETSKRAIGKPDSKLLAALLKSTS